MKQGPNTGSRHHVMQEVDDPLLRTAMVETLGVQSHLVVFAQLEHFDSAVLNSLPD